jgi:hypothetical protein
LALSGQLIDSVMTAEYYAVIYEDRMLEVFDRSIGLSTTYNIGDSIKTSYNVELLALSFVRLLPQNEIKLVQTNFLLVGQLKSGSVLIVFSLDQRKIITFKHISH